MENRRTLHLFGKSPFHFHKFGVSTRASQFVVSCLHNTRTLARQIKQRHLLAVICLHPPQISYTSHHLCPYRRPPLYKHGKRRESHDPRCSNTRAPTHIPLSAVSIFCPVNAVILIFGFMLGMMFLFYNSARS
ncbi:hypothetical protein BD410DRAFT_337784 [Rickenella mellea]|uniref:Uncharacterized protein n=1 Tax=Rickenella mellea TaxID=50990 RepID=A0A4Y7QM24_9AGAM|nr:hypothetical protein BD410DRAFT_337784 [Rickenella mellea]